MTWAAAHPVLHVLGFSAAGRAYLHQEKTNQFAADYQGERCHVTTRW